MHDQSYVNAGMVVKIMVDSVVTDYSVMDWWDRMTGESWVAHVDTKAMAADYDARVTSAAIARDDEVLYGHTLPDGIGRFVHVSEVLP